MFKNMKENPVDSHFELASFVRPTGQSRVKERGATLLEAIAFLGVAAIVMLGALSLFGNSFTTASSSRLVQETNAIATGVKALYSSPGTGGYANLTMADLYNAQVFPSTLQATNSGGNVTVTNQWGGAVTVTVGANSLPVLTYKNVPQSVCISTLVASNNWLSITVNTVAQASATLNVTQATAACSSSTSNTMVWGFS